MLREMFLGRNPSNFHINPLIKAFIISETFIWSAWNFVIPIFAVFAATKVTGGGIELAASAYSTWLISRLILEVIVGRYLQRAKLITKFIATITGLILMSLGYIGFAYTTQIIFVYIFFAILGIGFGISSPPKFSIFSTHLDRNKETSEWALYDASVFLFMALSATLGGFVAAKYGFSILFFLSSIVNTLGILPYIFYIQKEKLSLSKN